MQPRRPLSATIFTVSTTAWFALFLIGQLLFTAYVMGFYWRSIITGTPEVWNRTVPSIFSKDKPVVTWVFGLHVLAAGVVSLLGALQLIERIRRYAPRFHRVSGRVYIFSAFLIGLDGIFLVWRKDSGKDIFQAVPITVNALIILFCAWGTINSAIKRKIGEHNKWAVHLLLAMSGVWFFRVFLMLWLVINQGPAGFDPETFRGPFLDVLSAVVYMLPQLAAAWYLRTRSTGNSRQRWAFACILFLVTIGMAIGILAAVKGLWLPRLGT